MLGKGSWDRRAGAAQMRKDRPERTTTAGKTGQDIWKRTTRNWTAETDHVGQVILTNHPDRTERTEFIVVDDFKIRRFQKNEP